MMDFLKLRPSAPTAAALAEALDRARIAHTEAQNQEQSARQERDALLLDGDAGQLGKAEKALITARDNLERATAIVSQLEARHPAAVRAEAIAVVDEAGKAATLADAELQKWWEKNEAGLRRVLAEGHRLSVEAGRAFDLFANRRMNTRSVYADAEFTLERPIHGEHRTWPEAIGRLIQYGVGTPSKMQHQAPSDPAPEEKPDPMASAGSAVMAISPAREAGALALIYGGQRATTTEETAA